MKTKAAMHRILAFIAAFLSNQGASGPFSFETCKVDHGPTIVDPDKAAIDQKIQSLAKLLNKSGVEPKIVQMDDADLGQQWVEISNHLELPGSLIPDWDRQEFGGRTE